MAVPAVTDVSCRQDRQFSTRGRVATLNGSPTTAHFSHVKPLGQRTRSKYHRHAASFGNIRWKSNKFAGKSGSALVRGFVVLCTGSVVESPEAAVRLLLD